MRKSKYEAYYKAQREAYEKTMEGIRKAEERGAARRGMTVEEFRAYQAKQNKLKTYQVKIVHYAEKIEKMKAQIEEMKAWIEANQ